MVGTTLSHYKVLEKIGEGGMGEVYRAEDTNLSREVAIKVLPKQFTQDPQRLARFEREAKLLASLNHPNIAAIYGLEEAEGVRFLALELVEGETLAERIAQGPWPVQEALEVCHQIAQGVEAAHEKGVIHRDLKPGNVKITPEGRVKILDFGLAKAFEDERPAADISQSPTLSDEMTRAGVILGTAGYMSPEQARGKPVDQRADVFAFGAVLYECLTGKKPFPGETLAETIAAVLKSEPNWDALPATVPRTISFLVSRCLQKDPQKRLQHMDGARILIEQALSDPGTVSPIAARDSAPPWKWVIPWSIAAVAVLLGLGTALWRSPQPAPLPSLKFMISPSETETWTNFPWRDLALSPDGTQLVYTSNNRLYLRSLDQLEARPISGTQDGWSPFFSADGQSMGFFTASKLWITPLSGGTPLPISDVIGTQFSGSWGADDTIIFSAGDLGGTASLYRISAAGGQPESIPIGEPGGGESYSFPVVLPGGENVLFTTTRADNMPRIEVVSLKTRERRILLDDGEAAHYLPTGHLVYMGRSSGNLMAAPFDSTRLEVTGDSTTILQGVRYNDYAVSDNGTLAYFPGGSNALHEHSLVWVDRNGNETLITEEERDFRVPRISPDGKLVALAVGDPDSNNVWIYDLESDSLSRLTFDEPRNGSTVWSPDSKWLVFQSGRPGEGGMVRQPVDRSRSQERLTSTAGRQLPTSWSSDGRFVVFTEAIRPPTGGVDIGFLSLEEGKETEFILESPAVECCARLSPDGKWLAYVSDEEGRNHVYVRPFPEPDVKWMISEEEEGGGQPVWSPDGTELYYFSGDEMREVSIAVQGQSLDVGGPRVLFKGSYVTHSIPAGLQYYDISPDGARFLMMKEGNIEQEQAQINVVLNWFDELKRLVPNP